MANIPDGRYDRNQPGAGPLTFKRPWGSNEERLVTEALEAVTMPGQQVQMIPCPLTQVQLFPPRFGYGNDVAPGIRDVVNVDRLTQKTTGFSGSIGSYSGSSVNSSGSTTTVS